MKTFSPGQGVKIVERDCKITCRRCVSFCFVVSGSWRYSSACLSVLRKTYKAGGHNKPPIVATHENIEKHIICRLCMLAIAEVTCTVGLQHNLQRALHFPFGHVDVSLFIVNCYILSRVTSCYRLRYVRVACSIIVQDILE